MKAFVDDYNALMDKVYGLVTTKNQKIIHLLQMNKKRI